MSSTRPVHFRLLAEQGTARAGELHTRHGVVQTPVFMPVGTLGAVKGLDVADMAALGANMMLSNAYHLALRPGAEAVAQLGGLHRMMGNYPGAVLTDSGGFQVFSLAGARKVTEEGVHFRSHIDGAPLFLSPEKLVQVQEALAPDVAMVLDECPPGQASREVVQAATDRSTRWAERCLRARTRDDVAWFGIVQGGIHDDMRAAHAATVAAMDVDGVAIGGVSVGESPEDIARVVRNTAPLLPRTKARYLMGVGTPGDLVRGVASGVDMFDCVMPSRNARNGQLFTRRGKMNLKTSANRLADVPVDEHCPCPTCRTYSRAFLRHLFAARELTFFRLATIHNLTFYLQLMGEMRAAILAGTFNEAAFLLRAGEGHPRVVGGPAPVPDDDADARER